MSATPRAVDQDAFGVVPSYAKVYNSGQRLAGFAIAMPSGVDKGGARRSSAEAWNAGTHGRRVTEGQTAGTRIQGDRQVRVPGKSEKAGIARKKMVSELTASVADSWKQKRMH
jgi:hypothetical protein